MLVDSLVCVSADVAAQFWCDWVSLRWLIACFLLPPRVSMLATDVLWKWHWRLRNIARFVIFLSSLSASLFFWSDNFPQKGVWVGEKKTQLPECAVSSQSKYTWLKMEVSTLRVGLTKPLNYTSHPSPAVFIFHTTCMQHTEGFLKYFVLQIKPATGKY